MMFDAAIVGGGPAGASCALWLKQLGFEPVVIDKNKTCGGLQLLSPYTNTWIATTTNAHGGDVAKAMHENMLTHKISMRMEAQVKSVSFVDGGAQIALSTGEKISTRLVVLAGGVVPKSGGLASRIGLLIGPGHAVENTNFTGAKVAILGGGDNAFENYCFAKERGAAIVKIFARTLRARAERLEQVPPEHVTVGNYDFEVKENQINGDRFDHILVLYGYEVSQQSLFGLELAMRTDGLVATNDDCLTSNKLVYAIGEIAGRMHPCCVTSMADGVVAAKAIQRRLEASAIARYFGITKRAMSLGSHALKSELIAS